MLCVYVLELLHIFFRIGPAANGPQRGEGWEGVIPFMIHIAMSRPIPKGMVFVPF